MLGFPRGEYGARPAVGALGTTTVNPEGPRRVPVPAVVSARRTCRRSPLAVELPLAALQASPEAAAHREPPQDHRVLAPTLPDPDELRPCRGSVLFPCRLHHRAGGAFASPAGHAGAPDRPRRRDPRCRPERNRHAGRRPGAVPRPAAPAHPRGERPVTRPECRHGPCHRRHRGLSRR